MNEIGERAKTRVKMLRLTTTEAAAPSQGWGQENVALSNPGRPERASFWRVLHAAGARPQKDATCLGAGRSEKGHPRACLQSSGVGTAWGAQLERRSQVGCSECVGVE